MALQKLAKTLGKAGSAQIKRDMKVTEIPWTHKDKLVELVEDKHLSPSYIEGLIDKSKKVADLKQIGAYLQKPEAVSNLTKSQLTKLVKAVEKKVTIFEDSALLKEFLKTLRDNMMNHL